MRELLWSKQNQNGLPILAACSGANQSAGFASDILPPCGNSLLFARALFTGQLYLSEAIFFLLLFYQEAIAAESFIESTPMCIEKGDLEKGFADSDHVLQGEMRMGGQVCLLRLKMTIALNLVTQRAKEEPHAIHFGCPQPSKPM